MLTGIKILAKSFNHVKGALDKYNIDLFISYSIENFKLKQ